MWGNSSGAIAASSASQKDESEEGIYTQGWQLPDFDRSPDFLRERDTVAPKQSKEWSSKYEF